MGEVTIRRWVRLPEPGVEIRGLPESVGIEIVQEQEPEYAPDKDPLFLAYKYNNPSSTPKDVLDLSTVQVYGGVEGWKTRLEDMGYIVQVEE